MSYTPVKIIVQQDGSYIWSCSIDTEYHRKIMGTGLKACIGIAAAMLLFGAYLSYRYDRRKSMLVVAACVGVFLLVTLLVFGLTLLATDPQERYELTDTYIKIGSGRSSAFYRLRKIRTAAVTKKYIELQGKITRTRVYAPAEDFDFVRSYILNRLPGECDVRYA